jgi:hypothetical protein
VFSAVFILEVSRPSICDSSCRLWSERRAGQLGERNQRDHAVDRSGRRDLACSTDGDALCVAAGDMGGSEKVVLIAGS